MKKNGNISILVIFILLTSSLIGVIAIFFLKQLTQYSSSFYDHYKAYYIAKAGLELSLTQGKNNGIGFNSTVDSGNTLFSGNFSCISSHCHFDTTLIGKSPYLNRTFWKGSGCTHENTFSLTGGESLVIPLFTYEGDGSLFPQESGPVNIFSNNPINNEYEQILLQKCENCEGEEFQNQVFSFGIMGFSGGTQTVSFFQTGKEINRFFANGLHSFGNFDTHQIYYFIVSNAEPLEKNFCILTKNLNNSNKILYLPTQNFYIKSIGTYGNKMIGLEAVYKQPLPDFLINGSF